MLSASLNKIFPSFRALADADVVLLLGARLNWMLHFGQPPRFSRGVKFIQVANRSNLIHESIIYIYYIYIHTHTHTHIHTHIGARPGLFRLYAQIDFKFVNCTEIELYL